MLVERHDGAHDASWDSTRSVCRMGSWYWRANQGLLRRVVEA